MAISVLGATAEASAASGGITIPTPGSPANDDIWVAAVFSRDAVAHTLSGWTQLVQGQAPAGTFPNSARLSVWWFRYAGSNPNFVVGHTAGDTIIGGAVMLRGGGVGASPFTVGALGGASDATIEHTAITPGADDSLVLAINADINDTSRSPIPTGYTARFEDAVAATQNSFITTAGNDASIAIHTLLQTTAADTGTVVDTIPSNPGGQWVSVLVALHPEVAAATWTPQAIIMNAARDAWERRRSGILVPRMWKPRKPELVLG